MRPTSEEQHKAVAQTRQDYDNSKKAYHKARGMWNAWLRTFETIVTTNRNIEDWPGYKRAAEEAVKAAGDFITTFDNAQASNRQAAILLGSSGNIKISGYIEIDLKDLLDKLPKFLKDMQEALTQFDRAERKQLAEEIRKREWADFECIIQPNAPICAVPVRVPPSSP